VRWVLVLLYAAALHAQTNPVQTGGVNGRVANSVTGDLVPGATVKLIPLRYTGEQTLQLQTSSQADGGFHLDSVPVGTYAATAEKEGFVANQLDTRSPLITVQAGQIATDITVQVTPQGSIAGKVVDDEGKPVQGAHVRALSAKKSGSNAVSDEAGNFRLLKLPPGDYYVLADPPQKAPGEYVRTIFPHSLSFDDASTIQVAAGQSATDIDIRMRQAATYHIRGKISDPPDGATNQKFRVTVLPKVSIDPSSLLRSVAVSPDRTFDIPGLVPGNYTLRLTGQLNRTGRANRLLARQDVELGASSVEGLVLEITPPLVLNGHVTADSQTPVNLTRVRMMAVPVEEVPRPTQVFAGVAADGSFALTNLDPGVYQIRAMTNLPGMYIKSVVFNQQDILGKDIDLSQTGAGQLEVLVRSGAAEVDGIIEPVGVPALAVLVPESVGRDGFGVKYGYTGRGGTFSMRDLAPGRYAAYAVDRFLSGPWTNNDFLRDIANFGTRIQVDENSRQQVQLQRLPLEQVRQIAGRLGLLLP
jgi:Carboxypeptidase regulatory-like domain